MEIKITCGPMNCGKANDRPFLAYVNGKMLRDKRGVGRRFRTKEAAERAASKRPLTDVSGELPREIDALCAKLAATM